MDAGLSTPGSRSGPSTTGVIDPGGDRGHERIDIRSGSLAVGSAVEVRNRFDDRWIHGFSVAVIGDGSYQLRRLSDGSVLPAWFPAVMVRPDLSA